MVFPFLSSTPLCPGSDFRYIDDDDPQTTHYQGFCVGAPRSYYGRGVVFVYNGETAERFRPSPVIWSRPLDWLLTLEAVGHRTNIFSFPLIFYFSKSEIFCLNFRKVNFLNMWKWSSIWLNSRENVWERKRERKRERKKKREYISENAIHIIYYR